MTISTFNTRSLLNDEKLLELEEELKNVNWDIIGLSEVHRKGEELTILNSGHHFYYIGPKDQNSKGVGFLVNKSIAGNVSEYRGINERLAMLTLNLNKKFRMKILQVYFPKTTGTDEEVEELYEEINNLLENNKTQCTLFIRDYNAIVGYNSLDGTNVVGKYGLGSRNDR